MMVRKLDIYMQKNKSSSLLYIMHENQLKME